MIVANEPAVAVKFWLDDEATTCVIEAEGEI
jgi:hypothetical protein